MAKKKKKKKKYRSVPNWCGDKSRIIVTDTRPICEVYVQSIACLIARLLNEYEERKP